MNPFLHRWLIAAAAVGIHVSIGSVYAYSVWKAPLQKSLGWTNSQVSLAFSLAILFLGLSAAFGGKRVERLGPRRSCLIATVFFVLGLVLSAVSVNASSRWGFYAGYGLIAGIGLGIGYVSPVATLVKWFPDRRGFATGLATMGFGFGALLAGPIIAQSIPQRGIPNTFFMLAAGYALLMGLSSLVLQNPPADFADRFPKKKTEGNSLPVGTVMRDPRFYLLWLVFFLNICCGIAIISTASPLAIEMTGMSAASAAAMVGLMGLFNGLGRIGWSSVSDGIGRHTTWLLFFVLQAAAFLLLPRVTHPLLFQALVFLILSCYGGGFATVPAYVGDLFGNAHLSVIYGRLLTAWAAAGIVGPLLVAHIRELSGGYGITLRVFALVFALGLLPVFGLRKQKKLPA
jgi:OFA family oxalate/formate antiporter-like MFS transporter